MTLLRLLFSLSVPVNRRVYLLAGISLMALKYAVDTGLVWHATGHVWTPLDYLNPIFMMRREAIGSGAPSWLLLAMTVWALPFLWVGLSMTLRRAVDAGRPAALGLLYFVPIVNYVLMVVLCALPSRERPLAFGLPPPAISLDRRYRSALVGIAVGLGIAFGMFSISVFVLRGYGAALFVGTPIVVGAVAGFLHNRPAARSLRETIFVALLTVVLAGGGLVLFAAEGVMCVAMAAPPAFVGTVLGALVGRAIAADGGSRASHMIWVVLCLPFLAGAESREVGVPLREVISVIEIDAPPERVWQNVIGFSELPPPSEWLFRTGIAYPMRARIAGQGVGAVRHCEFSTGAFVEPITRWDPPRTLSFDVTAQPPPMQEWSPYKDLHPPHLDGYIRSKRGEFRLHALPGGRTRLEGSTWYELEMAPGPYWALWSDALIHDIHLRVLAHVKRLSERQER
jgi:uncharacterized membrane protein YhaH (DUF805 family)